VEVGKKIEGKGLRGIVRQGDSRQMGGKKDLSRTHFGEHRDRIARGYQLVKYFAGNGRN
jgi:hypothetical protein